MVSYVLCFQKLLVDWTQCAYDNVLSTSKIYTFLRHYSNLSPKLLCKVVFLFLSWQSCASISVYEYSMMLLLFPTRVLFPSVHTDNIYIIYSLSHYSTYTTIDNEPKCILSFELCKVFFLLHFNTVRTPAKHSTKLKEIKHIYSTMVTMFKYVTLLHYFLTTYFYLTMNAPFDNYLTPCTGGFYKCSLIPTSILG